MVGGLRSEKRSRPPHVSWTSPGVCLTHSCLVRPSCNGIFSRAFHFHSLNYAWEMVAKCCSLWIALGTAIMSQRRSRDEAIVLGRQDRASRVEPLSSWSSAEVRGSAVRLSSLKVSRRTALPEAGIHVYNETDAPFGMIRNLRCRGASPARPPAVCLPAPQSKEGAHEKNARECNSRGRVARRSG
jgi:hypothetical protein